MGAVVEARVDTTPTCAYDVFSAHIANKDHEWAEIKRP
jgi:hypothetical protein